MRIRHWDICAGHSEYGSIKVVKCLTWNKKGQRLTEHIFVTLHANGRNKSQNCWATMMGVVTSVCTWLNFWPVSNFAQQLPTTLNNIQQGVQTDTTCHIQQCWELLANNVASVCTGLKTNEDNNRNKTARLPIKQWFKCTICLSTEFKIRISITQPKQRGKRGGTRQEQYWWYGERCREEIKQEFAQNCNRSWQEFQCSLCCCDT